MIKKADVDRIAAEIHANLGAPHMSHGKLQARQTADELAMAFPDVDLATIGAIVLAASGCLGEIFAKSMQAGTQGPPCKTIALYLGILSQAGEQLYNQPDIGDWAATL